MKKTKIILVVILGSVVLFACLGFLGYFGVKTMRRSHLESFCRHTSRRTRTARRISFVSPRSTGTSATRRRRCAAGPGLTC